MVFSLSMRERKVAPETLVIDLKLPRVGSVEEVHFTSRKDERNLLRSGLITQLL